MHGLEEIQMESSALFSSDDEMEELPDFISAQSSKQSRTLDKSVLMEYKKTVNKIKRRSCDINTFCDQPNPLRSFEKNDIDPLCRTYEINNSSGNPLSRTYDIMKGNNNLHSKTENDNNSNNNPLLNTFDSSDNSNENPLSKTFDVQDNRSVASNPDEIVVAVEDSKLESILPGTPLRISASLKDLGSLHISSTLKPKMVPLGLKKESLISKNIKLHPRVSTLNKNEGVVKKNGPLMASRPLQNMVKTTQSRILKSCATAPIRRQKVLTHSSVLGDSFEGVAPTAFSTPTKVVADSRLPNVKTNENTTTTSIQELKLKQKASCSKLSAPKSRIAKHSEKGKMIHK